MEIRDAMGALSHNSRARLQLVAKLNKRLGGEALDEILPGYRRAG